MQKKRFIRKFSSEDWGVLIIIIGSTSLLVILSLILPPGKPVEVHCAPLPGPGHYFPVCK